ncbi:conserved hypothetical protein [Candidatus Magnetomoraceae bacterium gMMP-15]
MTRKHYIKSKSVIVCLNNDKIHLCDPFEYKWICDETKVAAEDTCKQKDKLLIKDFLTFSIQQTELLRSYGKLENIWKKLDRNFGKNKSVTEKFLSHINKYYLEESPYLSDASMCEECMRIFLGNLYNLLEELPA